MSLCCSDAMLLWISFSLSIPAFLPVKPSIPFHEDELPAGSGIDGVIKLHVEARFRGTTPTIQMEHDMDTGLRLGGYYFW